MSVAARLAAFAAVLVATFALGLGIGSTAGPDPRPSAPTHGDHR